MALNNNISNIQLQSQQLEKNNIQDVAGSESLILISTNTLLTTKNTSLLGKLELIDGFCDLYVPNERYMGNLILIGDEAPLDATILTPETSNGNRKRISILAKMIKMRNKMGIDNYISSKD